MTVSPGARLGPYEILGAIGRGGMGEVYRARDTELIRHVAIKVLPELFALDADRLARFTREAQTLAALNHPNIAQVHGLEGDGSPGRPRALVMELVDGDDLSALIARGPLPLTDVLPIARQIASALEAAHEAGIVHRDLKPANVKVRTDGTVKVLDFGLAKVLETGGGSNEDATITSPAMTQVGMIIGTAAYMAPEQAKGKVVDKRADIWAFGVVLYEMLAGQRAFEGDDISTTLAAVLMREPEWSALPSGTPAPLRTLIARCLAKDPRQRLRDIGDVRLMLDEKEALAAAETLPGPSAALWRRMLPLAATALLMLAVMATINRVRTLPAAVPETVRFSISFEGATPGAGFFRSQGQSDFILTNDGRALIVAFANATGARFLSVRRFDQLSGVTIGGSEQAIGPFVSPDDKWVGFLDPSFSHIRKVPTTGGVAVTVVQSRKILHSAAWLGDGMMVYSAAGTGLFAVPENGGEPVPLTTLDAVAGDTNHLWPASGQGKAVIFVIAKGDPLRTSRLAVLNRATGKVTRTEMAGTFPRFLPPGHVVYADLNGSLMAVPFDAARAEFGGSPVAIGETVGVTSSGAASYDVSGDGRLVYAAGNRSADRTLAWVDRAGRESPVAVPPRAYYYARISPDGTRLSLDIRDQDQDIWTWELRGTLGRVTRGPAPDQYGLWMPNSQEVIYGSVRDGKQVLLRTRVDGLGDPEVIAEPAGAYPNAVTPDGKHLVFRSAARSKGQNDLFIVPLGGDGTIRTLVGTEFDELNAAISPDGRWMAFESNRSGRAEVYVRPFPDVNAAQWSVSTAGGVKPAWAPNGRELFYLSPDRRMMSVAIDTAEGFTPSVPVVLFDASPYFAQGSGRNYDVSPEGTRFMMVKNRNAPDGGDPIHVVLNWRASVADRLPKAAR